MEFPWTKREIIDAVIAECKPFDRGDLEQYPLFGDFCLS